MESVESTNFKVEKDPVKTVIAASMVGTAIEFFDFYAYGTAAAAYFPKIFFPAMTPLIATMPLLPAQSVPLSSVTLVIRWGVRRP